MINKVILIGNVGQDPDVRYTGDANNGAKVATIRLATTERYKDRNGNTQEHTEWHSVVVWRSTAEIVEKYVRKGSQLYVEGRLRTRSWDDANGNKRFATEIMADTLQLLGRRSDSQNNNNAYGYQQTAAPAYQQQAAPSYQQPVQQQTPMAQQPVAAQNIVAQEDDSNDLPF